MPVASEALSGGIWFLFMLYGSVWRKLRGLSHGLLMPKVSDGFQPSQEWESLMVLGESGENEEWEVEVELGDGAFEEGGEYCAKDV
jgi:hypothetical protein